MGRDRLLFRKDYLVCKRLGRARYGGERKWKRRVWGYTCLVCSKRIKGKTPTRRCKINLTTFFYPAFNMEPDLGFATPDKNNLSRWPGPFLDFFLLCEYPDCRNPAPWPRTWFWEREEGSGKVHHLATHTSSLDSPDSEFCWLALMAREEHKKVAHGFKVCWWRQFACFSFLNKTTTAFFSFFSFSP
ncbi:hypothetical protein ABW19_dt0203905 [Dactylella cylindrospora]|nr:hypothetical protein ABW19_dt0203905 [Dactylella cylindrospora]